MSDIEQRYEFKSIVSPVNLIQQEMTCRIMILLVGRGCFLVNKSWMTVEAVYRRVTTGL